MGYIPPIAPAPPLNVDRYGLPRDFATYMWLLYRRQVADRSPQRLAFLHHGRMPHAPTRPNPGRVVTL